MGKKRRGPSLEELLDRPWCYYCERDFDDLKILISHQKAKHFKCDNCNRRLNTAGGLSVHLSQVHKEQLTQVHNALPNRMGVDIEIFGMEGIPADVLKAHQQRVASQFQQAELDRQHATGNPPTGVSSGGQPAKKPKLEPVSDLKKRLAEHKARRAEALAGGSSGDVTPSSAVPSTSTPGGYAQPPQIAATPQYSYPQPYGGPPAGVTPHFSQTGSPSYSGYSPVGGQQVPGASPYTPSGYPSPYPAGLPAQPPVSYGAPPFPQQQPPPSDNRFTGLPAASNLPQRPAFAVPSVNAHEMQQMHRGHVPSPTPAASGYSNGSSAQPTEDVPTPVDNQISGAVNDVASKTEGSSKPKKEKTKPAVRLVYNDDTLSPEEKMAQLPRYAYVPDRNTQTALGELPGNVIVGAIQDSDTVIDPAH
ncbi:Zinc finger, BED-type predicted [Penicillium italicum]|uniref:Zinc finger, BED-type predicted n=1 Tax=Penicillium italicum TaxID=40296 RepID=A0A0A2L8W1_PENIT|nr:Zinc finger, BED-type predicted [Penicillium italicum]